MLGAFHRHRHRKHSLNSQRTYDRDEYHKLWGSFECTNRLFPGKVTAPAPEQLQAFKANANNQRNAARAGMGKYGCDPLREPDMCGTRVQLADCDAEVNRYRAGVAATTCPKLCGKC